MAKLLRDPTRPVDPRSRADARDFRLTKNGKQLVLPNRLYKFMERKWANELVHGGAYRIGTLREYGNAEKHTDGILDTEEGYIVHQEIIESANVEQLSRYSQSMFAPAAGVPAENMQFKNVKIIMHSTEKDSYIYCFSLSPDWGNEISPDYDTCVAIIYPHAFIGALTYELGTRRLSAKSHMGNVLYRDRDHTSYTNGDVRGGGPPAPNSFLKPKSYEKQQEFRVVFHATTSVIAPITGKNPMLKHSCKIQSYRPAKVF